MVDKHDEQLFSILKEVKTLPAFFDVIFGFLFRRTDYYHVANDSNLGVGLPVGVAEKLLFQVYKKYATYSEHILKPPEREEIVTTEQASQIKSAVTETKLENSIPVTSTNEPLDKKQSNLECYNGAVYDNYSWSQTITDVDIQIKIPEKVSSKNLSVDITSSKMCVKLKNSDRVYLEGDFCRKCKTQESIWSLDGCILQIHLDKTIECWWDCLVQSEPRLDFSKMDCSRPFNELSDEAQAKIEELTWNQERKKQGLPTSDQLELEKTLKKAWNAEGSPFTGEYDPSKVSLS